MSCKSLTCLLAFASLCAPADRTAAQSFQADTEVAVIGGQQVSFGQLPPTLQTELQDGERRYQRQLQQLALDHQRSRQSLIEARTQNYLDRQLLQREAQAQNVSVEELSKQVKPAEVSDADIRAFYEQHQQQFKQPFEAVMVSITQHLLQQAHDQAQRQYLDALRVKYAARLTLPPLRESVAAEGPGRGPASAPVVIVEFADFQCPYCRQMAPLLKQLLAQYPKDVRLVYRQMPLSNLHPDAMHSAQASLCADEQGKFWDMHDALFADPATLSLAALKGAAARLQLRPADFERCLDSGKTEARVKADAADALAHGVDGTPGLFINGRYFSGALPYAQLSGIIDDELRRQPGAHLASTAPASP